MSGLAATPMVVNLGVSYTPPVVTVLLLPADTRITDANYRADYLDNVELSTPARVYLSGLTGPGPPSSTAVTQTSAGRVFSFIPGDYAGAVLVGQDLHGSIFDGADMQDANFSGANLQGAQFINTSVAGALFTDTDLRGADLKGAVGLRPDQMYRANFDSTTIFPDGMGSVLFGTSMNW